MTSEFPWQSPYIFAGNNPINSVEIDGKWGGEKIVRDHLKNALTIATSEIPKKYIQEIVSTYHSDKTANPNFSNTFYKGAINLPPKELKERLLGFDADRNNEEAGITFEINETSVTGYFDYHRKDEIEKTSITKIDFMGKTVDYGSNQYKVEFSNTKNLVATVILSETEYNKLEQNYNDLIYAEFEKDFNKLSPKIQGWYKRNWSIRDFSLRYHQGYAMKQYDKWIDGEITKGEYNEAMSKYKKMEKDMFDNPEEYYEKHRTKDSKM